VTVPAGAPVSALAPGEDGLVWHTLRAERFGPNKFDAGKAEPRWLGLISWAEQVHTQAIAHTMGVVTFSLYALFFSVETRDERRSAFSLDTFSDAKFLIATGVSILTLLLTTVFGPLQSLLKTTSLDVRQWLLCVAVALSIVVVSEIQKAVRRHTASGHQETR